MMVLIGISLKANDGEHLFMGLPALIKVLPFLTSSQFRFPENPTCNRKDSILGGVFGGANVSLSLFSLSVSFSDHSTLLFVHGFWGHTGSTHSVCNSFFLTKAQKCQLDTKPWQLPL